MAQAFNLTAQLNLRGPRNIGSIVSDIKKQVGTITGDLKFKLDPAAAKNVASLNASLKTFNTTLGQTTTTANSAAKALSNLRSSVTSIKANKLASDTKKAAASIQQVSESASDSSGALSEAKTEMEEFGRQGALAIRRFAAFSVVSGIIFKLSGSINQGVSAAIDFERQMVRIEQITGKSQQNLQSLSNTIANLSTSLGVSSESLIGISDTLAQAGLSASETQTALKALALTELAPSFTNLNQTVEGSVALMRQFSIGTQDLEKALSSINSVAASFAVESADLITAIQRAGGVFATASSGVSTGTDALNEFLAVFTSVRSTTRESAETIATGLRTIFTRIQRGDTIDALEAFGVQLTDVEGKFVGAFNAVEALSRGLSGLDPRSIEFGGIVEQLGGFRQIGKVIPLIQRFSTAQEALKVAQTGQGSLAVDAVKAQQSLANQISKVREQFITLTRDIVGSDTFQTLAKGALGVTKTILTLANAVKGALPVLALIGLEKGASALQQFGTGFFGGLKKVQGREDTPEQQTNTAAKVIAEAATKLATATSQKDNNKNISSELNKNISALSTNTSALTKLTSSVDALANVVRSSNTGRPGGSTGLLGPDGKPLQFARGGSVPGTGNRDTVPAMLQPGEFVIRKKAVDAIGVEQLQNMNKYGSGGRAKKSARIGTVQKFADGGDVYESSRSYGMLIPSIGNPPDYDMVRTTIGCDQYVAPIEVSGFSETKAFDKEKKKLPKLIDKMATNLSESIGGVEIQESSINTAKALTATAAGKLFEGFVFAAADLQDPGTDRFDIPVANQTIKGLTDQPISDLTDVKLSDTYPNRRSIIEKAVAVDSSNFSISDIPFERRGRPRADCYYNSGGMVQKFLEGGMVQDIADQKSMSVEDVIKEQLGSLGGIQSVKQILGLPKGDRTLDSILRSNSISSNLDQATEIMNQALQARTTTLDNVLRSQAADFEEQVGIVGLLPIGYNKDKVYDLANTKVNIKSRGLGERYKESVNKMQAATKDAAVNFANDLENANIFQGSDPSQIGPVRPIAFDFDETLASNTAILDSEGKEDIPQYYNRDRVAEALRGARPTPIVSKLLELEKQSPGYIRNNTRVLTARPQSTADLVAETLQRFGLPYETSSVTGVSQTPNTTNVPELKAQNMSAAEKLIDDSLSNVTAVLGSGKAAYRYQEPSAPTTQLEELTGQGNIEGAIIERTMALLGAPLPPGAEQNRAIDYPNGLGAASQYFPGIDSGMPTEVKRIINKDSLKRARGEFTRYFEEKAQKKFFGGAISGNTGKVYNELLKAVLPSEMFQGDKLMTKDGQEWEAPRDASFNWRGILYRLLGGKGGAYIPNFTKDIDSYINAQGLSSDIQQKASSSLSDSGSNQKRWLAVFDKHRDDIIAHEGFHDVQSYLQQNYPDISSKLDQAVISRQGTISDFIRNTKGLGYSAKDVFDTRDEDDLIRMNFINNLNNQQQRRLGKSGIEDALALRMRNEAVPMLLESYKSSKDKQAEALLKEIFAESGLQSDFFTKFKDGGEAAIAESAIRKDIGVTDAGSAISAYFTQGKSTGDVVANNIGNGLYAATSAQVSGGGGRSLYDAVMETATANGGSLTSDRSRVSSAALTRIWTNYFNKGAGQDGASVGKSLVPSENMYTGSYFKEQDYPSEDPSTWTGAALPLQYAYTKAPTTQYMSQFASGGSVEDTVPALLTPGEFVINKKAAAKLGAAKLNKLNKADKIQGYNKGGMVGGVAKFEVGGEVTAEQIQQITNAMLKALFEMPEDLRKASALFLKETEFAAGEVSGSVQNIMGTLNKTMAQTISGAPELVDTIRNMLNAGKKVAEDIERSQIKSDPGFNAAELAANPAVTESRARRLSGDMSDFVNMESIQQTSSAPVAPAPSSVEDITEATRKSAGDLAAAIEFVKAEMLEAAKSTKSETFEGLRQSGKSPSESLAVARNLAIQSGIAKGGSLIQETGPGSVRDIFDADIRDVIQGIKQAITRSDLAGVDITQGRPQATPNVLFQDNPAQKIKEKADKDSAAAAKEKAKADAESQRQANRFALSIGVAGGVVSQLLGDIGGAGKVVGAFVRSLTSSIAIISKTTDQYNRTARPQLESLLPKIADKFKLPESFTKGVLRATDALFGYGKFLVAGVQVLKSTSNAYYEWIKTLNSRRLTTALDSLGNRLSQLEKNLQNINNSRAFVTEVQEAAELSNRQVELDRRSPEGFLNFGNRFVNELFGADRRGEELNLIKNRLGELAYAQSSNVLLNRGAANEARQEFMFNDIIPQLAIETSNAASKVINPLLQSLPSLIKSGEFESADDFQALLGTSEAASSLAASLAATDVAVQREIEQIKSNIDLTEEEKNARVNNLQFVTASTMAQREFNVAMRQIEFDRLNKQVNQLVSSLSRLTSSLSQIVNRFDFASKLSATNLDLITASLSGQAKLGSINLESIDILRNPRAYSDEQVRGARDMASSSFGLDQPAIRPLLDLVTNLEDSMNQAINSAIQENPGASDKALTAAIEKAAIQAIRDLELPQNVEELTLKQVRSQIQEISTRGDGRITAQELIEALPALSKQVDAARSAQESAVKALEAWQNTVNSYTESMNRQIQLQVEYTQLISKAASIQNKGIISLSEAFKNEGILRSKINAFTQTITDLTSVGGGAGSTSPADIGQNILNLEKRRKAEEDFARSLAENGSTSAEALREVREAAAETAIQLRQNYAALQELASNSEVASAALSRINEIQGRISAGTSFLEKLATSSAGDINKTFRRLGELSENLAGNTVGRSTAQSRSERLQLFNSIAPLLGTGRTQNEFRANVLGSMLKEANVPLDSNLQNILDALRDPESDSEMAETISIYKEAVNKQAKANEILAGIKLELSSAERKETTDLLISGFEDIVRNYITKQLEDISAGIRALPEDLDIRIQGRSDGGIIYAAGGSQIFKPKGTDTVPAMLTPGEFVVNKQATSRNLGILKSINNGDSSYYADGGFVGVGKNANNPAEDINVKRSLEARKAIDKNKGMSDQPYPYAGLPGGEGPLLSDFKEKTLYTAESRSLFYGPANELNVKLEDVADDIMRAADGKFGKFNNIEIKSLNDNLSNHKFSPGRGFTSVNLGFNNPSGRELEPLPTKPKGLQKDGLYASALKNSSYNLDSNSLNNLIKSADYINKADIKDVQKVLDNTYNKLSGVKDSITKDIITSEAEFARDLQKGFNESFNYNADVTGGRHLNRVSLNIEGLSQNLDSFRSFGLFGSETDIDTLGFSTGGLGISNITGGDPTITGKAALTKYKDQKLIGSFIGQVEQSTNLFTKPIDVIQDRLSSYSKALSKDEFLGLSKEGKRLTLIQQKIKGLYEGTRNYATLDYEDYKSMGFSQSDSWNDSDVFFPLSLYAEGSSPRKKPAPELRNIFDTYYKNTAKPYAEYNDLARNGFSDQLEFFQVTSEDPLETQNFTSPMFLKHFGPDASSLPPPSESAVKVKSKTLGDVADATTVPVKYNEITGKYYDRRALDFIEDIEDKMFTIDPIKQPPLGPFHNKSPAYANTHLIEFSNLEDLKNYRSDMISTFRAFKNSGDPDTWNVEEIAFDEAEYINKADPSSLSMLGINEKAKNFAYIKDSLISGAYEPSTDYVNAVQKYLKDKTGRTGGSALGVAEDLDSDLTDALRVTMARFIEQKDQTTGIMPESLSDINSIRSKLNSQIGAINDPKDSKGIELEALRRLYTTIGGISGVSTTQTIGLSPPGLMDAINQDSAVKVDDPNLRGRQKTLYYEKATPEGLAGINAYIDSILSREVNIIRAKRLGGSADLSEDLTKEVANDFKGGRYYEIGADGSRTEITPDKNAPNDYKTLFKRVLTPTNIFPGSAIRSKYLDELSYFFENRINNGQQVYTPDFIASTKEALIENPNSIQKYFENFDKLIDSSMDPEEILDNSNTPAELRKTVKIAQDFAKKAHTYLTARRYGTLFDSSDDLEKFLKDEAENPVNRATGGMIYANEGRLINFQPRGTDTVPAMLTPGEFVVNRQATQKNLPLLKQINGGAKGYQDGGVAYHSVGGIIKALKSTSPLIIALTSGAKAAKSFQSGHDEAEQLAGTAAYSSKLIEKGLPIATTELPVITGRTTPPDVSAFAQFGSLLALMNNLVQMTHKLEKLKDAETDSEAYGSGFSAMSYVAKSLKEVAGLAKSTGIKSLDLQLGSKTFSPQLKTLGNRAGALGIIFNGLSGLSAKGDAKDMVFGALTGNPKASDSFLNALTEIGTSAYDLAGAGAPPHYALYGAIAAQLAKQIEATEEAIATAQRDQILKGREADIRSIATTDRFKNKIIPLDKPVNEILSGPIRAIGSNSLVDGIADLILSGYGGFGDATLRKLGTSYGKASSSFEHSKKYNYYEDKDDYVTEMSLRARKGDPYAQLFRATAIANYGSLKTSGRGRGSKSELGVDEVFDIQSKSLAKARKLNGYYQDILRHNQSVESGDYNQSYADSNPGVSNYFAGQKAELVKNLTANDLNTVANIFQAAGAKIGDFANSSKAAFVEQLRDPVYASSGSYINFQPKGTDTVPAMLTPGEFVVNRESTQKHLGVLRAINSGEYSVGGIASYLQGGGLALPNYYRNGAQVGPSNSQPTFDASRFINNVIGRFTSKITSAIESALNGLDRQTGDAGGVSSSIESAVSSIDQFVSRLDRIASTLSSLDIPQEIKITGKHEVNVIINGDAALNSLKPDLAELVTDGIKGAFNTFRDNNPSLQDTMNFDVNP